MNVSNVSKQPEVKDNDQDTDGTTTEEASEDDNLPYDLNKLPYISIAHMLVVP